MHQDYFIELKDKLVSSFTHNNIFRCRAQREERQDKSTYKR